MLPKTITSLQHPLVSHWLLLRKERPFREEKKEVLIAGETLVRELSPELELLSLITDEPVKGIRAKEHYLVTPEILKKITGLGQPDGFAAVVALPQSQDLRTKKSLLVLDQLADPGNIGTLLRTALALGWEGIVTTPGTVDLFNDKAIRAARGATFRLPYMHQSQEELALWLGEKNPILADIDGECLDRVALPSPVTLILSSEAHGPQSWAEKIAQKVSIPMQGSVESLNVASAGAILLYALRPR